MQFMQVVLQAPTVRGTNRTHTHQTDWLAMLGNLKTRYTEDPYCTNITSCWTLVTEKAVAGRDHRRTRSETLELMMVVVQSWYTKRSPVGDATWSEELA